MNTGAAKGQEEMAAPATTINVTINETPGSPPVSAVALAAAADAAAAADDEDNNNDNDNNNNVNLNALCRHVPELCRMLNASADCLANAKADAAVALVDGAQTSELAKRRAGEWICQVEEQLRRTRIKAKRFRAGWT